MYRAFGPNLDGLCDWMVFREALHAGDKPVIGLDVSDLQATYEQLSAKGVTFTRPPIKEAYGGYGAGIDDGCGNIVNLHQEA